MKQPDLILFAKQPIPGQVKTRLMPEYSAEQAAEIAAFMTRATVELAVSAWPGEVYLYCAPHADHALFRELERQFRVRLAVQAPGDLGEKMLAALRDGIARSRAAAVMGCDVPHCPWDVLDHANERLAQGHALLGPTEDGGYYFIGLSRMLPELFHGIEWGGAQVRRTTLARAEKFGIEFEILPELRDVDTPLDLWLVSREYAALRRFVR